jgi:hypothetical protein
VLIWPTICQSPTLIQSTHCSFRRNILKCQLQFNSLKITCTRKKKKKKKKKSLCNLSFFFFKTCESDCAKITTLYSTRTFDTRFTCSFARRRASPRRADRCVHGLLRAFADLFVVFGTIVNTRRLVECALDACRRRTDGHRHCASGGAVCQFCRSATDCGRGDTFVALYQQQYKWWHRCVGRYRFAHHAATAFGRH